ncbi:MAG: M20 family peptidase [Kofleriaceae bacterium]|nr:M20 family peptidase [Kofleriaceae bacterium]
MSADKSSAHQKSQTGREHKKPLVRQLVRWILWAWLVVLVVVSAILIIRTVTFRSRQMLVSVREVSMPMPKEMAERLAESLKFKTSRDGANHIPAQSFYDLHEHLRVSFPRVEKRLVRENIANYSLLYTWRGSSPELPSLILAAHLDVVPADPEGWEVAPFAGVVRDGFVHGRGALDDKVSVVAILEAIEQLLRQGFTPTRTIYLAFGHDEELGGHEGAAAIAEILSARNVRAEATIDEGLVITQGILDGIDQPLALIGVAEKGMMNVELRTHGQGGHSSMPPAETAVGILSKAIVAIQSSPMPASIDGAVAEMFSYVGPEFSFGKKLVMANLWLFGPLVRGALSEKPATDALLRTTIAPTMISGGIKANVLPQEAKATVNFRIKPGETGDDVLNHLQRVISDKRVSLRVLARSDPILKSNSDSRVYKAMVRSIRRLDPEILVAPGLMLAMTDSRHYAEISEDIYRFTALRMGPDDLLRLHGKNERIEVSNYAEVVAYNILLLQELAGDSVSE